MAADQWRKRLNSTSVVKRRNTYDSILKSHISLEWDANHKRVIARKDQFGISWTDLKPFIASSPHVHNVVAGVSDLPHEIYQLENLKDVLSFEVWLCIINYLWTMRSPQLITLLCHDIVGLADLSIRK